MKTYKGKTWRQHASPYLKKALTQAAKTWRPKTKSASHVKKMGALRKKRDMANKQLRELRDQL